MEIKLLRKAYGCYSGKIGDIVEIPDEIGKKLIASGHAEAYPAPAPASPATAPVETATLPQNNETTSKT